MSVSLNTEFCKDSNELKKILSFHELNDDTYCQNTNVPFMIFLMAFHPDDTTNGVLSIFTPEAQFNGSNSKFLTGRKESTMHQHNCFEFTYILSGNMYQIVEGKRFYYPTGSCCLMNRNTLHTEILSTDFTCIFFSVSPDFITRLNNYGNYMIFSQEKERFDNPIFRFLEKNLQDNHANIKDFLDFIPHITEKEQKTIIHNIFENMLETMITPYYGATYNLQDLFLRFINVLCDPKYYSFVHISPTSNNDSQLFARIDTILEQYHGRITNRELSRLLHYNGSYLGSIVKKYTGQSLFSYSMNFTMKEAARLLKSTDTNITDISVMLGFSNRTHFYKIFEKYYKMTPKEYRRTN